MIIINVFLGVYCYRFQVLYLLSCHPLLLTTLWSHYSINWLREVASLILSFVLSIIPRPTSVIGQLITNLNAIVYLFPQTESVSTLLCVFQTRSLTGYPVLWYLLSRAISRLRSSTLLACSNNCYKSFLRKRFAGLCQGRSPSKCFVVHFESITMTFPTGFGLDTNTLLKICLKKMNSRMCAAIAPNNAILAAWKLIFKLLQLSKKTFLSSLSLS